ncbi:competence protein ComEA [Idiomarina loihiensis]|uniref:helix-hairpin-helix domain-containing protein n=1 Tax=Idiomarina TaxID=135575 RepID=UPI000D714730|nr:MULTISPECIES: helix-hairpin-helix domain-containing protein [Idiomarina]PWW39233.1 competence protein ComEA [Idiomarina loihiensis]TDP49672.1 competence protein ComEA [Idiomarina loihiensis]TDS24014.1 competence protein ComEA [Idiomarina sp. H2]
MKLKLISILVASSLFVTAGAQASPLLTLANLNLSPAAQAEEVKTVNINTGSAQEISAVLVGVGEKRAEQIIELREQLGGFTEVEQLLDVKGIGIKTLEKNRAFITIQ